MKKAILLIFLFFSFVNARYINGLVATVDDKPITDYEIKEVMQKMNVDAKNALNILIKDRLEDVQISTLQIDASEFEIDNKISELAKQNNMSISEFKNMLSIRGIDYDDFRDDVGKNIEREKLFARILNVPNQNITPENAKRFYETNLNMFAQFRNFNIIRYSSANEDDLKLVIKNPMSIQTGVQRENLTLDTTKINPQLRYILVNTKDNSWTPILKTLNGFDVIYVISRGNEFIPPFEDIEKSVISAMANQEREATVADYFNKLKVRSHIEIIKR